MALGDLYKGGTQEWKQAGGMELPVFVFVVSDLEAAKKHLRGMCVELDVRFNTSGDLAYHLDVPDLKMPPWAITLDKSAIPRIEEGARMLNIVPTMIAQQGAGAINLNEFYEDLTHDWSGAHARGHKAFMSGDIEGARRELTPLTEENPDSIPAAHHLLGRCARAKNDFAGAVEHYSRAARAATHTKGHFLPIAGGILSDMGVSLKKQGKEAQAAHCFAHSLRLRPNHPAGLATYFTLFGAWEEGFAYCLARIAAIGGHDDLLRDLSRAAGSATGRDPAALVQEAKSAARGIDLGTWPLGSTEPIRAEAFFQSLGAVSGDPARPALPRLTRGAATPEASEEEPAKKPWWKFW